jgi:phytanoyl-CoA hydroxylase
MATVVSTPTDQSSIHDAYQNDGFVLVKGLITPEEAGEMRQELHDLFRRALIGRDGAWGSAREVAGAEDKQQLQGMHDVQFYSAVFSRMLVDRRFVDTVAAALGVEDVQLHHTKAFVKPPERGAPFPLHQDYPFFPHTLNRVAACIFHLDAAPEEKGCVTVVRGSHNLGPLEHTEEGNWHLPVEEWPVSRAEPVEAEAGDVLIFSYLMVHGSGVNRSDQARTTWLVQVRDPADKPTSDAHTFSRGQGMMLRGRDPEPTYRGPGRDRSATEV